MNALVLLSGWLVGAIVAYRWSQERTTRIAAESLTRSLLAANAEKDEVIRAIARRDAQLLSDRVFALFPANETADEWSRYEVQ